MEAETISPTPPDPEKVPGVLIRAEHLIEQSEARQEAQKTELRLLQDEALQLRIELAVERALQARGL